MSDLDDTLSRACMGVPGALGIILCDYEGEKVVLGLGGTKPSPDVRENASEHVPRDFVLTQDISGFLLQLAGAEVSGLLEDFSRIGQRHALGTVELLRLRYAQVELLVHSLPEGYFVVMALSRPGFSGPALGRLLKAAQSLAREI